MRSLSRPALRGLLTAALALVAGCDGSASPASSEDKVSSQSQPLYTGTKRSFAISHLTSSFQPTGVFVQQGQRMLIRASGSFDPWATASNRLGPAQDPDGNPGMTGLGRVTGAQITATNGSGCPAFLAPNLIAFAVIGRVGSSGTPFYVGSQSELYATASGELQLAINDSCYGDNDDTDPNTPPRTTAATIRTAVADAVADYKTNSPQDINLQNGWLYWSVKDGNDYGLMSWGTNWWWGQSWIDQRLLSLPGFSDTLRQWNAGGPHVVLYKSGFNNIVSSGINWGASTYQPALIYHVRTTGNYLVRYTIHNHHCRDLGNCGIGDGFLVEFRHATPTSLRAVEPTYSLGPNNNTVIQREQAMYLTNQDWIALQQTNVLTGSDADGAAYTMTIYPN